MSHIRKAHSRKKRRACSRCGKTAFNDQVAAAMAGAIEGKRVYYDDECASWHLATKPTGRVG